MKPRKRKKLKKLSYQSNPFKVNASATTTLQGSISTIYPVVQPKPHIDYSYVKNYIRLQSPIFPDLDDLTCFKGACLSIYRLMR